MSAPFLDISSLIFSEHLNLKYYDSCAPVSSTSPYSWFLLSLLCFTIHFFFLQCLRSKARRVAKTEQSPLNSGAALL